MHIVRREDHGTDNKRQYHPIITLVQVSENGNRVEYYANQKALDILGLKTLKNFKDLGYVPASPGL